MITVAFTNEKGGVAKTTTAQNMGADLKRRGYRVLFVDLDAQANLTYAMNAERTAGGSMAMLLGEPETVQQVSQGDIIAGSKALATADLQLTKIGKEYRLREALAKYADIYDFCIIDTAPALGILTINALTAADTVVVPVRADIFSLTGIDDFAETLTTVKKYCNPALDIAGIVLTQLRRVSLANEIQELLAGYAAQLGTKVFTTAFPSRVAVQEAQATRQSIFEYAPTSGTAQLFTKATQELLDHIERNR